MTWFLMRLPRSRAASNCGKSASAAARLRSAVPVVRPMAIYSVESASASSTRALNVIGAVCIGSLLLADGR